MISVTGGQVEQKARVVLSSLWQTLSFFLNFTDQVFELCRQNHLFLLPKSPTHILHRPLELPQAAGSVQKRVKHKVPR